MTLEMIRRFILSAAVLSLAACFSMPAYSQAPAAPQTAAKTQKVPTNRYSMKLTQNPDGTYSLQKAERYAKLVDLSKIEDLTVPFTLVRERLSSKDYKGVETKEFVYAVHEGYDVKLKVDLAVSDGPAPVVFYLHGGGWSRGNFESNRVLSQYMAKQKGVAGVRIEYTMDGDPQGTVEVAIQDVLDAVEFIRAHAAELNIDPSRVGFVGNSAGAHLAACGAMLCKDTKVFAGYSGIYDLTTAAITVRAKQPARVAYFEDKDEKVLADASPVYMIPKKRTLAAMLVCGTADITVEWSQSEEFAEALEKKGNKVALEVYENYDHNLSSNSSDKMEEIFFKTVDFISENI